MRLALRSAARRRPRRRRDSQTSAALDAILISLLARLVALLPSRGPRSQGPKSAYCRPSSLLHGFCTLRSGGSPIHQGLPVADLVSWAASGPGDGSSPATTIACWDRFWGFWLAAPRDSCPAWPAPFPWRFAVPLTISTVLPGRLGHAAETWRMVADRVTIASCYRACLRRPTRGSSRWVDAGPWSADDHHEISASSPGDPPAGMPSLRARDLSRAADDERGVPGMRPGFRPRRAGLLHGAMYVSYALGIPLIALLTLIEHLIIPELVAASAWCSWPGRSASRLVPWIWQYSRDDLDPLRPVGRPDGRRQPQGPSNSRNRDRMTRTDGPRSRPIAEVARDLEIAPEHLGALRPRQGQGPAGGDRAARAASRAS